MVTAHRIADAGDHVASFPPVVGDDPRVLILGSMPGVRSLCAGEYYAHPRNGFWPIMGQLLGFDPAIPYTRRLALLTDAGVALWDVLQSCDRPGSADSAIAPGSRVANDIAGLLRRHPAIRLVVFNGAEAEKSYRRYVVPRLPSEGPAVARLPSTSPAYAALSLTRKQAAWAQAIKPCLFRTGQSVGSEGGNVEA